MTADDELRAVLHAHTIDAPDADAVHIGIRTAITRRRKQRQVTQAAGVAIVVGGLAVAIPVFARTGNDHRGTVPTITTPGSATSVPAIIPSELPSGPSPVKKSASAGPPVHSDTVVTRFFAAGYTYDDALALQHYWHMDALDPYDAKVLAGQIIEDGKPLPFAPGSSLSADGSPHAFDVALAKFWSSGHTLTDAERLQQIWNQDPSAISEVKAMAGQKLLDGKPLPL